MDDAAVYQVYTDVLTEEGYISVCPDILVHSDFPEASAEDDLPF